MLLARHMQLLCDVLDELLLLSSHLYADHLGCSTAEEFEGDAASAAEKVERTTAVEVKTTLQDVEQRLLGKVGGGACLKVARRFETTSAVLSGDDLHKVGLLVDWLTSGDATWGVRSIQRHA